MAAPTTTPVGRPVSPGDTVRITMNDGRRLQFTGYRTVDAAGIIATNDTRYDFANIRTLERRAVSGLRTSLLIGGIAAGVFLVVGILYANALGSLLGG